MSNPAPLAALMCGFVVIILLLSMLAFYVVGRLFTNRIATGICNVIAATSLGLALLAIAFIVTILK